MNSPDSGGNRGIRKSARNSARWLKDVVKRAWSPQPPSENLDHLVASSIGTKSSSMSRHTTPLLASAPLPTEPSREVVTPSPGPSTQIDVPEADVRNLMKDKEPSGAGWNQLVNSLRKLESGMELFPPLKSAVSAFIGCLDIVQRAAVNRADYEELADEFQSMADMLNQYASELESEPTNGSIANIAQCIQRQVADIERKQESGTIGRLLNADQNQEEVIRHYRQVEKLFRQLQYDLSMRTRNDVKKQLEMTLLQRMSAVDDARYNSSYSTTIRRRACTVETREAIHQNLQDWTTNSKSEKIYWMNGMAGTGKTTIAYSFCEWLEETNRLGASFFCSRISATCRLLNQIIPTIAYQLAQFSPAFRSKLCVALNSNPDAGKLNVVQQFEKLISRPLSAAKGAIPDGLVIVIDALDECDDSYSVRLLLDLLLKFAEQLPLKFFVSSRPEPVIRERMMSQGGATRSIVYLHDIEASIVEEDIKKYLTEALQSMHPPPSSKHIGLLAKRSRNLFIYAATVVRYIYPEDVLVDSNARLKSMMIAIGDPKTIAENKYDDLDRLYTAVLGAVFHARLDRSEKQQMERVLWTIVCAREPITVATIALLASLGEEQVWAALQSLRSVVHVPEDNSLISTLHASFPEYMLDESRSKGSGCNESKWNEALAHRCFYVMKLELKFNICGLENSFLTDERVPHLQDRVAQYISPALSYACRYWSNHLQLSPAMVQTRDMLLNFLSSQLLFWMEVLSLCRCLTIGASMMQQAQTWLRQVEDNQDEMQKQLSDARNFVTWFAANPCSRSTPHIYVSALPLCAKSSWVYQHYMQRTTALANISVQHDEAVLAIWTVESGVRSSSISPKDDRIATGSSDGTVHVYDMHTGAILAGPFKGHTNEVNSVAFSPSGAHIASGSDDKTIIVWDALTGRVVIGPLHKHTSFVMCVAFSPDGTRIVSGSLDQSIIVWDSATGKVVLGPLQGHTSFIQSTSFSPDGRLIASCSYDRSVRLWGAHNGAALAELEGHEDRVTQIAFSPNGSRLASCSSDGTIRLWDVEMRAAIGQPLRGHEGRIWSIAYSSDSSHIVSGGVEDHSIIVWETHTGLPVIGPLSGHSEGIDSIGFTSDNSRVISCSEDRTIRIWDINMQSKGAPSQENAHEVSIGQVVFLPNHTQIVSNSSSGGLRVWDMHTGRIIPREFQGQTGLETIAVSSRGTLVAASTSDLSVRVWDTDTGKAVCKPLNGHNGLVKCLCYSPSGAYICSGTEDGTIIIWDIKESAMAGQPYKGHTGTVNSVAYSPDGTCLASAGADCTVMIWDTSTGKLIHALNGHEAPVSSVAFFLNGSHIVSGSIDGAIRKWEVKSGHCASTLFEADPHLDSSSISSSGESTFANYICLSPDGTRIVSGFGSSLRLVDSQNMKPVTRLGLSQKEAVHWVGYSSNGTDIISVSIDSIKTGSEETSKAPTRKISQSPNIIRVWRTGVASDQPGLPPTPHSWSYQPDGRVLSPEGLKIWVPPDLLPLLTVESDCYFNPLVMTTGGVIDLGYKDACVGNRWFECYTTKDPDC